jgi:signal transduction histidine kinase
MDRPLSCFVRIVKKDMDVENDHNTVKDSPPRRPPVLAGLSARLLLLTILFVMLSEVLIYAPSIARFRKSYLEGRIEAAHLETLALETLAFEAPLGGVMFEGQISRKLARELLFHANAYTIVLRRRDKGLRVMLGKERPKVDAMFDLRKGSFMMWLEDAFSALLQQENRTIRVIGVPLADPEVLIEVVFDETPMRRDMYGYSTRILELSVVISLFTAFLVYLSLQWLMVRPMRKITKSMARFRENPEGEIRGRPASGRSDEIGIVQNELRVMQDEIRSALRQKTRLAALGTAVAKINHDLRNSLATAVLASDRLANIDDPEVQRLAPRLYGAIDRAIDLCSQTLNYAAAERASTKFDDFSLHELVAEAAAVISGEEKDAQRTSERMTWLNKVDISFGVHADRAQVLRALVNLGRNAEQAGAKTFKITAEKDDGCLYIDLFDDGPGLPPKAKEKLFQPFVGSARKGGTGLGLVIVRDIMQAHGGAVKLVETGDKGTLFRLELPISPRGGRG